MIGSIRISPSKRDPVLRNQERFAPGPRSMALLARIVTAAGEAVQRADIASIKYSIYELDRPSGDRRTVLPGHCDVLLDVRDVFSDSLRNDRRWTIDREGYNFRHVVAFDALARAGARYQICYELVPRVGPKTILHFNLGPR
jgi:hypothetical protein